MQRNQLQNTGLPQFTKKWNTTGCSIFERSFTAAVVLKADGWPPIKVVIYNTADEVLPGESNARWKIRRGRNKVVVENFYGIELTVSSLPMAPIIWSCLRQDYKKIGDVRYRIWIPVAWCSLSPLQRTLPWSLHIIDPRPCRIMKMKIFSIGDFFVFRFI